MHTLRMTSPRSRFRRAARAATVAGLLLPLGACPWFTDFKETPMVSTWESVADSVPSRGQPQFSVPVGGTMMPAFRVSYAPLPATVDSMSGLVNPVAADARSLDNGRKYYQINCAVCHGDTGAGNGPATRYGFPGINIITATTAGRSDGYIWGIMRNGRGLMPSYNRIPEMERWDVVNYVRGLQGRHAVRTGPVGRPGETGSTVPGATELGPTRPFPYTHMNGTVIAPVRGDSLRGAPSAADTSAVRPAAPPAATPGVPGAPAAAPASGDTTRRQP